MTLIENHKYVWQKSVQKKQKKKTMQIASKRCNAISDSQIQQTTDSRAHEKYMK